MYHASSNPLSPLIFAIVAVVLLRKLGDCFPDCLIRAFADDTAMVVSDLLKYGNRILDLFEEYRQLSGLALNLPKTVLIPLSSRLET